MYIYEKQELKDHPQIYNAVILCELQTHSRFCSIYRDKNGELTVSFYGILSENKIKNILMHFKDLIDGDTNVDNISCTQDKDYNYEYANFYGEKDFTHIFTPDGYDYSKF